MKFCKLIEINFKYFLNKKMLILLGISIIIVILCLVYNTNFFISKEEKDLYFGIHYNEYHIDSTVFLNVILMLISIFTPLLTKDNYDVIYLAFINKYTFNISKLLSYLLLLLLLVIVFFSLYIFIPSILLTYYYFDVRIIKLFFDLYLQMSLFLIFSLVLYKKMSNIFSGVIIFIYFWFLKLIIDDFDSNNISLLVKIAQYLSPNLINNGSVYFFLNNEF